jgi:hypothetical protein
MLAPVMSYGTGDMRVHWWVQYELAAKRIQRAFRRWNCACQFRRNYSRKQKILLTTPAYTPTLEESFRGVVSGQCTLENKLCIWRAAVELRRAHKIHSTDLIIRALIDSAGDQSRAVVLLGTKDYALLNKADVPVKLRRMFLPSMESRKAVLDPYRDLLASSVRHLNRSRYDDGENAAFSAVRQNNINVVRALKNANGQRIIYEKSREQMREELFSILNAVVERSYLSKNHHGSKEFAKTQKTQHPATVTSRNWLNRQYEEMLSPNLDSLISRPGTYRNST